MIFYVNLLLTFILLLKLLLIFLCKFITDFKRTRNNTFNFAENYENFNLIITQ